MEYTNKGHLKSQQFSAISDEMFEQTLNPLHFYPPKAKFFY